MSKFLNIARSLVLVAMAAVLTTTFASGQTLKKGEVKDLIGNAKTAQDHQRLADYYTAKAAQFESEAVEHTEEAAKYKANPTYREFKIPGLQHTATHCESMARNLREAAKDAKQLAEAHQAMAKTAK